MISNRHHTFGLFLAIFVALSTFTLVYSQEPRPKATISLKSNMTIPFKDGKTVVVETRFSGLDSESQIGVANVEIPESDLKLDLGKRSLIIAVGEKFDSEKVEACLVFIKKWLAERGFRKAQVTVFGEKLLDNQMNLVFMIDRGPPVSVSETRFLGNLNVPNEELQAGFNLCLGNRPKVFERRLYEYCANKEARSVMFKHGYFRAKITKISPELSRDGFIVTIGIDEGERYRIGKIEIDGVKSFSKEEILEIFGQKQGDIADGRDLQEAVYDRIKLAYSNRGFWQYNAEFEPDLIEPQVRGIDGTLNLTIFIDEGKQFKLNNIQFLGVETDEANSLRKLISIENGDVLARSKLEKGFGLINQTKKFREIGVDYADTELLMDEVNSRVNIVIQLKRLD